MNSTATVGASTTSKIVLKPWDLWALALPLIALLPLLLVQWQHLMNRPERQFLPVLMAVAIYFPIRALLDQRAEALITKPRMWAAVVLMALSLTTLVVAVWQFSPWLAHVSALATFAAWGLGRFPELPWTRPIAWCGLLAVTLPLPFGYDEQLIIWLQRASATACGNVLDALNVPHMRTANIIEIKDRKLFVEEACSGIGSLYALLAAAALMLLLNRRSLLSCILVVMSVPMWAYLGNLIRLLTIALAQEYYGRDLSNGLDHELLGVATFCFAAFSLWMTDWLVAGFLQPLPPSSPEYNFAFQTVNALLCWPAKDPMALIEEEDELETAAERNARIAYERQLLAEKEAKIVRLKLWEQPLVRWASQLISIVMLVLGGLVGLVIYRNEPPQLLSFGLPEMTEDQLNRLPGKDAMPASLGEWRLIDFGKQTRSTASEMGAHSFVWEYRTGSQRLMFSLDFPFRGFHALEQCYQNSGWTIENLIGVKDTQMDAEPWDWREANMVNQFGSHGYLCYALMTDKCRPYGAVNAWDTDRRIFARLFAENAGPFGSQSVFQPLCYQVQMVCETGRQLSDAEKAEVKKLFLQVRDLLSSKIKSQN